MRNIDGINEFIQTQLVKKGLFEAPAVEVAKWLDKAGLLKDREQRPGMYLRRLLRRLLRQNLIVGQHQEPNRSWFIRRVNPKNKRSS